MSKDQGRRAVLAGLTLMLVGSTVALLRWPREQAETKPPLAIPSLFAANAACPFPDRPGQSAARLERNGKLLAERYPYDPQDGVRGAQLMLQAHACYRLERSHSDMRRTKQSAWELTERVEADYAAAQLVLQDALASGHWEVAAGELRRLLGFTRHLGPGAFVRWLRETQGKVIAHASVAR